MSFSSRGRSLAQEEFYRSQAADVARQSIARIRGCRQTRAEQKRRRRHALQIRLIWLAIGFVLGALFAKNVMASDLSVVVHGISKHGESVRKDGQPYNETNPGFGVRFELTETVAVQAGRYENSWSGFKGRKLISSYVLVDYMPVRVLGGRAGVFAATSDEYPWNDFRPLLMPGLVARWTINRFGIALRGGPTKHSNGVIAVEGSIRIP